MKYNQGPRYYFHKTRIYTKLNTRYSPALLIFGRSLILRIFTTPNLCREWRKKYN